MAHDFMIPKHKKLTGRAKVQEETNRAVKHFLEVACKDRLYLLAIVTGGLAHFKIIAGKAFKGFYVSDQMIGDMFGFLVEQAGPDPVKQYDELQRSGLVALKLDKLKGLARFITSERHLDQVLDKWIPDGDEKVAIRSQMLFFMKTEGLMH